MQEQKEMARIAACVQEIRRRTDFTPRSALVLGSGLGEFGKHIQVEATIPYGELPGFPVSTVAGHSGCFLLGKVGKEPVVAMQGRVHYYEGYSMEDVVLPIRVMQALGAKRLFLTNAAGGIDPAFSTGNLMLITDHISFFVPSPLRGPNLEELGPRFPDMSQVYSPALGDKAREAAVRLGIPLREGIYLQTQGPAYETPAEVRLAAQLGASAVGMSTACEATAARHMGMEVCGISCITNLAAGLSKGPLNHAEVQETARRVAHEFEALMQALLTEK